MPRKRRQPKRRAALPQGLAEISLCERSSWSCYGPFIAAEGDVYEPVDARADRIYHAWPDWATWGTFYESVREELFAARPSLRATSVADACYIAWRDGRDPGAVRDELCAAQAARMAAIRRRMQFGEGDGGAA